MTNTHTEWPFEKDGDRYEPAEESEDVEEDEQHRTRVSRGTGSTYVVICDVCNVVGQPQDYEADAEAIAARHTEIGGFERPSRN